MLPLIIGIGQDLRGDDAVGIRIVRQLEEAHPQLAEFFQIQSDFSGILNYWSDRDVVLIDAVNSNHYQPGVIHIICSAEDLIAGQEHQYSTHGLGIIEALKLSHLLDKLPNTLFFMGVEGEQWELGKPLSDSVERAIPTVCKRVRDYIKHDLKPIHQEWP